MSEAVIVAYGRSAIGKAPRGLLRYSRPEEILAQVFKGVLKKVPKVNLAEIDDIIIGCAFPEAEQGMNIARIAAARAGIPDSVPGQTINRFCSSGLQSIAIAANSIIAEQCDCVLAAGVELMSVIPMGGNRIVPNPYIMENRPEVYVTMGITAENVAEKYNVTREMQDEFAVESQRRAFMAQKEGKFDDQIIPVEAVNSNGEKFIFDKDQGIRPGTNIEVLSKLRPAFKVNGTVTAGNSSQTSDGAGAVLLMSAEKAKKLGIKPIALFKSFTAVGVDPSLMGIGPMKAIPKVLGIAGLSLKDMDLIELNEAFASQSIACINELGLNKEIVNVNGGAISLGHPLGCTGSFLTVKLLSELQRRKGKYGLVSMCIGGGMGAAGIFELL